MFILSLVIGAHAIECSEDTADATLERARSMMSSFIELDTDTFETDAQALEITMACASRELEPDEVVELHVAKALAAFVGGDVFACKKSWGAAQQVGGDSWDPPADLVLPNSPFEKQCVTGAVSSKDRKSLEREPGGGWTVDGLQRSDIPLERAFVLQGYDSSGSLVHAGYHYSEAEVPQLDWESLDATNRERRRKRMRLIGTSSAGAMAVGSAVALGIAGVTAAQFDQPSDLEPGEASQKQLLANGMTIGGAGMGAAAVGFGIAAWTVNW